MAKYRQKDETDLVWNRTRRQITRDLDTQIQNFREELLNTLLSDAWGRYVKALDSGTLVQLEDEAADWIRTLLDTQLKSAIEGEHVDVASS